MFHVIGMVTTFRAPLLAGGALLVSDGFDPPRTLQRLGDPALGVTHYFCVPQMAARLRDDPAYDPQRLAGRVSLFSGGAPHARAAIMRWVDDGIPLADGFGMSEAGTVFCMPADLRIIADKAGAAGVPTPGVEARIVADGAVCADGAPGELQLRGANVAAGYWRAPAATAAAYTADGWLLTGDVAVRDADGFYTLVDRKKDMFISGGENVYPAEVEAALADCPGLAEAAVVGVADARWGEAGHCAIVLAPGASADAGTVRRHLEGRIARHKLPAHVTVLEALPRTGSGKVRKDELRRLLSPSAP
jgi:fatty-acyl-CoA synthase